MRAHTTCIVVLYGGYRIGLAFSVLAAEGGLAAAFGFVRIFETLFRKQEVEDYVQGAADQPFYGPQQHTEKVRIKTSGRRFLVSEKPVDDISEERAKGLTLVMRGVVSVLVLLLASYLLSLMGIWV